MAATDGKYGEKSAAAGRMMPRRKKEAVSGAVFWVRDDLRYGIFLWECVKMETRIALIGIIVEQTESVEQLNRLLHEYGSYIIGRMGIPYRERELNIISVAMDAPQDIINALSGKVGRLPGISAKTIYQK